VFSAGQTVFKPFLEITPEEIQNSLEVSVSAAFTFSREAILAFKDNTIEEPLGKRGTLIFTGATASLRGNTMTSLLAASKFGARALSQSLAKEFGKDNIHVCPSFFWGS
jgi:NAD(P)-dependent dehydrogenase (short-subunit alcohol dehydrogenase family)